MEEYAVIAKREGKNVSRLKWELITEHVRKHSKGNPAFTLETWQQHPTFLALPSLGESLTPERLRTMADSDVYELAKNVIARGDEIHNEVEKRGFYGLHDMRERMQRLRG